MADTAGRQYDTNGLVIRGATKHATKHKRSTAERARRCVAEKALDAADRALLLDMLGLVPDGMQLTVEVP